MLSGVVLGVAIPVAAFRYFTPDAVFLVVYRRGRTAHVDVTGRRGTAIRQAVHDQLGLTVLDSAPVGLESSAGSTPLRLTVQGDPDEYLFGKLYTLGHVRADRWYKLWRTILYGTLEDEHPFSSVRQLTQYEDYVLRDAGVRSAKLRPGRGPPAGHPGRHRGRVRAEIRSGPPRPADRGPGALRARGGVLGRGQLCRLPATAERLSVGAGYWHGCCEVGWRAAR